MMVLLTAIVAICSATAADVSPERVDEIKVEGNETIAESVILQKVTVQPGRTISNRQLREAKRALYNTGWFYSVAERFEPGPKGTTLIFQVHEKPIVRSVRFIGLRKVKEKEVVSWTGLKVGSSFDVVSNKEAVQRIKQEYKERGHYFVKVDLLKGGDPEDREVVIRIQEGPVVRVNDRTFRFVDKSGKVTKSNLPWFISRESQNGETGLSPSAARLETKLQTKESWFGLFGGLYKPESIEQDVAALKQYYRGLGFFDIQIEAEPGFTPDRSGVQIVYTVNEGVPYKVRNVEVSGNHVIPTAQLRAEADLLKGQYFNSLPLSKDVQRMQKQYDDRGHYFASVVPVPKFTEQPGIVDIVFEIDEDRPRFVRNINVRMQGEHPHTMEVVPVNLLQIEPGDLANAALINRGRSRAAGSGILENVTVEVKPVDPGEGLLSGNMGTVRAQNGSGYQPSYHRVLNSGSQSQSFMSYGHSINADHEFDFSNSRRKQNRTDQSTSTNTQDASGHSTQGAQQNGREPGMTWLPQNTGSRVLDYAVSRPESVFHRPPENLLVGSFPASDDDVVIRGQSPGGPYYGPQPNLPGRGSAVLEGSPYNNQFQALPPGWVDIDVSAAEGRTGRLMFGAGVNSDAGIVGNFVWDERNFNLFRPPRTFADIIDGRAFRGGGQRFRLEAAPGDQVSRYVLSWTDPYFLYSDYSFGVSGFYFNRFYPDWDETRTGGRITLGKQLTPEWSLNAALRLENVEINNPRLKNDGSGRSVSQLERVRGSNFLSSFRASVSHDTRDSSLLPSTGHFTDLAYEIAFGDFQYPRFEGEARQYFTMYNRPDGSGKHVLTLAGNLGWSGSDTPVFEKYYAGGFQSFRGFAFRGVTPRSNNNIAIGGNWQMLGTAEYRIPLTADDMINLVTFTDVGTVTQDVSIDNFRVTVGVGLRVVVPAMGPVPLAFDFGFPIKSAQFDDERIFSFYVGINR